MRKNFAKWILFIGLVPAAIALCQGCWNSDRPDRADLVAIANPSSADSDPKDSKGIIEQREKLDKTVWAGEVAAQKHETVFVQLWDRIRAATAAERFVELASFPFEGELSFGTPAPPEKIEAGISLTKFQLEPTQKFSPAQWREFVHSIQAVGIGIVQTEWHHSRFVPATDSNAAKSTISFSIHAIRQATKTTFAVKGDLEVQWSTASADSSAGPVADSIAVTGLTLQERSDGGLFSELFATRHEKDEFISAYPVLVYDLDNDGLSDIILPRWNRVYWNVSQGAFERDEFLDQPIEIWETGVLSDFNGDGNADFVTVGKDGLPYFYAGTEKGKFPGEPAMCANVVFDLPTAITAGDADGDGDLDLWMTQYKLSYQDGQMPTPFYDANDGFPSYFLINDGNGAFTDATEDAGLSTLRNRRTYSASFVDLDEDGDLDLMNVSDFAGLDIYENLGNGSFELATEDYVKERNFFGMGHTIGDYNQDGLLDFYVIGMSSTTARRLDRLNLGRDDRPDVHPMRAPMGFGNRLYFGTKEKAFREDPNIPADVTRTGWSYGVTSFDFDLDGDLDIYVANGFRSGKSSEDYCSTFWRHDIYTGDSNENPEVLEVFKSTLGDMSFQDISWNGYEKNVLLLNQQAQPDKFINSSFMFGSAYAFDARSVVSDDFDADGRPDLVVAETVWNGKGLALLIHVLANKVDTGKDNNWLAVRLRESPGPGFSPNGAKVVITDAQALLS